MDATAFVIRDLDVVTGFVEKDFDAAMESEIKENGDVYGGSE